MVMAYIQIISGNHEAALDEIELLLSIPALTTLEMLKADPIWEPVWEHPRFEQLLAEG